MLQINLLPENLRKAEATPLPRFITIVLGIVIILTLGFLIVHLKFFLIPDKEAQVAKLSQDLEVARAEAAKLGVIEERIRRKQEYIGTIESLFRERVVWAKILWDLKAIVTRTETMNTPNPERRYLWLTSLRYPMRGGADHRMRLEGYASAENSVTALSIVREFLTDLREYRPTQRPEEAEGERLDGLIRDLEITWRRYRTENPDLPEENPRIDELRQRRDEMGEEQSGPVANMAFHELFVLEQVDPVQQIEWTELGGGQEAGPSAPAGAMSFELVYELRMPEPPAPPAPPVR